MNARDQAAGTARPQTGSRAATLITAAEFARLMQISRRTLWRLVSAGKVIQPVRIGGNTQWRLSEVEQWIDDGCPPSAEFSE
jgi:excisionase family DNA binding protein